MLHMFVDLDYSVSYHIAEQHQFTVPCIMHNKTQIITHLWPLMSIWGCINSLRPRQNRRLFPDDTFKCFFVNENVWITLNISLTFVPKVRINNILALVQIMAWSQSGDELLSKPITVSLPTHICVTRPQWVKRLKLCKFLLQYYSCYHSMMQSILLFTINGFNTHSVVT